MTLQGISHLPSPKTLMPVTAALEKKIILKTVIQRKREEAKIDRQMRGWNHHLGAVETIYEEECEFSSASSSSVSPSISSPTSLHSRVEAWSLATGKETDVLIRVQGACFRLHKIRLTSRSSYLKRHLSQVSDFTLSPPLNITAETFAAVADFCYSYTVKITPTNVAALRTAAELLGMTENRDQDDDNLGQMAETYFRGVIGINQEYASMVLRSCLPLLPEAETTASLVSRCIEALISADDGHNHDFSCLDDVVAMHPEDFQVVAESMRRRLTNQDVLYRIVDLYLKENNYDKITEEQKTLICNSIDCTKLSPQSLVECVQNPRMPLRFIVRAMLVEQLNTRHSIISAATGARSHNSRERRRPRERTSTTLGEFLHRDAALRQAAQLKAAMDSTTSRIQSLEKELSGMKKLLLNRQLAKQEQHRSNVLDSERSASFHFAPAENGKIERGERGSVSSSSFRFDASRTQNHEAGRASFSGASCYDATPSPRMTKTFRQRLINGLKNAFRAPNSASN